MDALFLLVGGIAAFVVFDLAALRWGADTRDDVGDTRSFHTDTKRGAF